MDKIKYDVIPRLEMLRKIFPNTKISEIVEEAILEIEQLRRDTANKVASDLYSGVRR
jgi:hypothetical protein